MDKVLNSVRPGKIIIPIILGLSVSTWMLMRNYDSHAFSFVRFSWYTFFYLLVAIFMMFMRDVGYIYRIYIMTEKKLTFRQAFNIIMLWEFSSAVSPSVVGGTAPAIYFLSKEGLNVGESTAVVLAAIFLDEMFFLISVPLVYVIYGINIFPPDSAGIDEIRYAFYGGYAIIFVYTLALFYALFINPQLFKSVISWIFLFPWIKRWRIRVRKSSNQLIRTSIQLKKKPASFWIKSSIATIFSWTGRYWVVNFLLMAFFHDKYGFYDQFLIYGRQLSMWIILLISPTPGGSGIAEYIFNNFLGDFIPDMTWSTTLAIFWRLISYYPYLFIGVIILPVWIKNVVKKSKKYKKVE